MTFTGSKFLSTKFLTTGILAAGLALGACGEGSGAATPEGGGKHPLVGNPAPSFEVDSLNGQGKVSFDKWKGKVVYVDFWASWCGPCRRSFPWMNEMEQKDGGKGLVVVVDHLGLLPSRPTVERQLCYGDASLRAYERAG